MTDESFDPAQSATPEDIATLYFRAHMQGAKYWDFSALRREAQGQFRQRMVREQAERTRNKQQAVPPPIRPQVRSEESRTVAPPPELKQQLPMVAVFSLAGGVGKTCLVATLGRALSALGEHVLLADTAPFGLLPFYFGSRECKPGVVRTFSPPPGKSDLPVQVLSLDAERYPDNRGEPDPLLAELATGRRGIHRILLDLASASRDVTRRLLLLRPTVLVPVVPEVSSVVSLESLEAFLAGAKSPDGGSSEPVYLLNQFDASSPAHLDLRDMLQQRLGDRLLPFVLHRSSAVGEALAEGMTVIDYAPDSEAAQDYRNLAVWLRSLASPATVGSSGQRWSEA